MVRGSYVVYYPRSPVHQQPSRDCPRTPAGAARGTSVASGSPATTIGHSRNPSPYPPANEIQAATNGARTRGARRPEADMRRSVRHGASREKLR